jgi:hypothetical protein
MISLKLQIMIKFLELTNFVKQMDISINLFI